LLHQCNPVAAKAVDGDECGNFEDCGFLKICYL